MTKKEPTIKETKSSKVETPLNVKSGKTPAPKNVSKNSNDDPTSTPFAVIETGNQQYIVRTGMILSFEKLDHKDKDTLQFDKVLLYSDASTFKVGQPYLTDVVVHADILNTEKDKKVIGMKFKRKTGYKKVLGHRQWMTTVKISKFSISKAKKAKESA
ncbi:MAG: 50S ribosomal protein L21 [bacterium]